MLSTKSYSLEQDTQYLKVPVHVMLETLLAKTPEINPNSVRSVV